MHSYDSSSSSDQAIVVPPFLKKLWRLVESNEKNLISWSDDGQGFIIKDATRFANELLPDHFKHRNMSSFIRQLNMYGFRKNPDFERSTLTKYSDALEFQNAFFQRGKFDLLQLIKRKPVRNNKVMPGGVYSAEASPKDLLLNLTTIRERQESVDVLLEQMKKENELLWRELTTMRQKHKQQEQIIQTVIQFLVSLVQRSGPGSIPVQRKFARMLQDKDSLVVSDNQCGPVIHEVTDDAPFSKILLDSLQNSDLILGNQTGEQSNTVSLPGKTAYIKLPPGSRLITLPQANKASHTGGQFSHVTPAQLKNASNNVIALKDVPNSSEKMLVMQPSTSQTATSSSANALQILKEVLQAAVPSGSVSQTMVARSVTPVNVSQTVSTSQAFGQASSNTPITVKLADKNSVLRTPDALMLSSNQMPKSPAASSTKASITLKSPKPSTPILIDDLISSLSPASLVNSMPTSPASLSNSPAGVTIQPLTSLPSSPATQTSSVQASPEPLVILPDTPDNYSSIPDDCLTTGDVDLGSRISIPESELDVDFFEGLPLLDQTLGEDTYGSTTLNTPLVTLSTEDLPGLFNSTHDGSTTDYHDNSYVSNVLQNHLLSAEENIQNILQFFDGECDNPAFDSIYNELKIKAEPNEQLIDSNVIQEGGKRKCSTPVKDKRHKYN